MQGAPLARPQAAAQPAVAGAAEPAASASATVGLGSGAPAAAGVTVGGGMNGDANAFRSADPRANVAAAKAVEFALGTFELSNEVRRVFTDSMRIALRGMDSAFANVPRMVRMEGVRPGTMTVAPLVGPNTDGRTRIVITPFTNATGRKEMTGYSQEVANYLRASLPSERYDVVDQGTTDRATRASRDRMAVGWMLRSDFVVSGVVRERNDSLTVLTVLTDVRGGRHSRAEERVYPMGEPKRALDVTLDRVNSWLDSARTRAARMPKPPTSPRGPGPGSPQDR